MAITIEEVTEILQALQKQMNNLETKIGDIQDTITDESNILGLAVQVMTGAVTSIASLEVKIDQIFAVVTGKPEVQRPRI